MVVLSAALSFSRLVPTASILAFRVRIVASKAGPGWIAPRASMTSSSSACCRLSGVRLGLGVAWWVLLGFGRLPEVALGRRLVLVGATG